MANPIFISWTDTYEKMRDKFVSNDFTVGSVSIGDKTITYNSADEFMKIFIMVELRAKAESGEFVPRTYAGNGGRGI